MYSNDVNSKWKNVVFVYIPGTPYDLFVQQVAPDCKFLVPFRWGSIHHGCCVHLYCLLKHCTVSKCDSSSRPIVLCRTVPMQIVPAPLVREERISCCERLRCCSGYVLLLRWCWTRWVDYDGGDINDDLWMQRFIVTESRVCINQSV